MFKYLVLSVLAVTSIQTQAINKVIYGDDDRLDRYEVTDQIKRDLQDSTLAMIPITRMVQIEETIYRTSSSTIQLCEGARFNKQIDVAECSGFLVEKDSKQYVVTAGHCMSTTEDCTQNYWVFGYSKKSESDDARIINKKNIYRCKSVVAQELNYSNGVDYAVIELDRLVKDRKPLTYRKKGFIKLKQKVFVIGHPDGLPSKVSSNGYVRKAKDFFSFETNLDTFSGNSGSAVFNESTNEVEGILIRGDEDYTYNAKDSCFVPNVCSNTGCGGEDVHRINMIPFLRN